MDDQPSHKSESAQEASSKPSDMATNQSICHPPTDGRTQVRCCTDCVVPLQEEKEEEGEGQVRCQCCRVAAELQDWFIRSPGLPPNSILRQVITFRVLGLLLALRSLPPKEKNSPWFVIFLQKEVEAIRNTNSENARLPSPHHDDDLEPGVSPRDQLRHCISDLRDVIFRSGKFTTGGDARYPYDFECPRENNSRIAGFLYISLHARNPSPTLVKYVRQEVSIIQRESCLRPAANKGGGH